MYIHEAVEKALKNNGLIYRKSERNPEGRSDRGRFAMIKPTNGYDACRILVFVCGELDSAIRRWNPSADDLMADDWCCEVYEKREVIGDE